jgi:hypothetical protein
MNYSIIVKEPRGKEVELCRVGSNPEAIAEAARGRSFRIGKRTVRRYVSVRIVEIESEKQP